MMPYIIIIILFIWGIYVYEIRAFNINKLEYYYLLCLYLTLLSGLSYRLGSDGPSYEEWFSELPSIDHLDRQYFSYSTVQPLFLVLAIFSKNIINDVWLFHTLQSGIVCFTMFWFIRKHTKYIFSAGLIFAICAYTYFCFEIWKESLSISMVLISYYYLEKRNWIGYFIFGIISFLFHFSAALFLLIPILRKLRLNLIYFIILGAFWILFEVIVQASGLLMYSDLLIAKYDRYLEVADNLNTMWYLMSFCKNVIAPLAIAIWFKYVFKNFKFEWSYCAYVLFGIGTLQFGVLFERPTNYFLPFIVISIAQIIGNTYKLHKHHIITVVFSFVFCISCRGPFLLSHEGWRVLVPYESVFTKKINKDREKAVSIIHVG